MIFPSFIVIENFYENPEKVREYALMQQYITHAGYPGKRTIVSYYPDHIHNVLKTILAPYFSNIDIWHNTSNGEFQITNKYDETWVHRDRADNIKTTISGVCYLTPNPPAESGTIFFERDVDQKYMLTDRVANKFNRLILFNGNIFHSSDKYFGSTDIDSRLTQVFFLECS